MGKSGFMITVLSPHNRKWPQIKRHEQGVCVLLLRPSCLYVLLPGINYNCMHVLLAEAFSKNYTSFYFILSY